MEKEENKIFGFRRNVFFLGIASMLNDISAEMVQSVMPVFLTTVLGAPVFMVGVIEGVADSLANFLKLFSGWLSDKIHKRKLPTMIGYAISVTTRLFLVISSTFQQVFVLRVIDRFGKGLRDAPRDALIAESTSRGELGKSFGLHRAMDAFGATLGPLMAFFLLPFLGGDYRMLFFIAFILGLLAIASFIFIKEVKIKKEGIVEKPIYLNFDLLKKHKKFTIIVGTLFVFGLGALPIGLLTLKAVEVGSGSLANVPLMYFVYSITFVLTAIPLGKLADRIGEKIIIAGGFLMATFAYISLLQSSSVTTMTLSFVMLGLYIAATDGLQRTLVAKALDGNVVAMGQGFLGMANGFSSLGAGVIGGLLWTFFGSSVALLYAATMSIVGFSLFFYVVDTY